MKGNTRTNLWTAKIRRRAGRGEATIGSYSSEKVQGQDAAETGSIDGGAVRCKVFGFILEVVSFVAGVSFLTGACVTVSSSSAGPVLKHILTRTPNAYDPTSRIGAH